MTKEEWLRRYAERIFEVCKMDKDDLDAVEFVMDCQENAGYDELDEFWKEHPEDSADEEMSYWDDDDDN